MDLDIVGLLLFIYFSSTTPRYIPWLELQSILRVMVVSIPLPRLSPNTHPSCDLEFNFGSKMIIHHSYFKWYFSVRKLM
jgi:hypothetical protein